MVQKFMVEKSRIEKFLVEKFGLQLGVEKSEVEISFTHLNGFFNLSVKSF